ncbi:hypothetical protein B0H13DRAFT_1053270 [Mycena leptocephala]|nr:hypothetical protein B0H13DRAFT_1053270 [Mycena leptocephala]
MPAQPIPSRMQVPRSTQACPVRRHRAHTSYTPHPRVRSHHQPRTAPKHAAHEVVSRDSQSKWRGNPKPTLRMRPAACFIPLPQHSLSSGFIWHEPRPQCGFTSIWVLLPFYTKQACTNAQMRFMNQDPDPRAPPTRPWPPTEHKSSYPR